MGFLSVAPLDLRRAGVLGWVSGVAVNAQLARRAVAIAYR
jgi:hypothetical protein